MDIIDLIFILIGFVAMSLVVADITIRAVLNGC